MSTFHRRAQNAATAPAVERTKLGSVIWPDDTRAAFYQMCDLARVPPDHQYSPDVITKRLHEHGEATKRTTVMRIMQAFDLGWGQWRNPPEPPLQYAELNLQRVDHLSVLLADAIDGGLFDHKPSIKSKAADVRGYIEDDILADTGGW